MDYLLFHPCLGGSGGEGVHETVTSYPSPLSDYRGAVARRLCQGIEREEAPFLLRDACNKESHGVRPEDNTQ